MLIYLAGSVTKGDKEKKTFENWRLEYSKVLGQVFNQVDFIDPADAGKDEEDSLSVTGEDAGHIKMADLIIVNGEQKLGAGTAMELVIAKYFKKPVITILPKDSHHRRSNITFHEKLIADWIHPFIHTFSDLIIEKIEDIEDKKDKVLKIQPKDITIIDKAIDYADSLKLL